MAFQGANLKFCELLHELGREKIGSCRRELAKFDECRTQLQDRLSNPSSRPPCSRFLNQNSQNERRSENSNFNKERRETIVDQLENPLTFCLASTQLIPIHSDIHRNPRGPNRKSYTLQAVPLTQSQKYPSPAHFGRIESDSLLFDHSPLQTNLVTDASPSQDTQRRQNEQIQRYRPFSPQ